MREQRINEKTAKLAKEVGFNMELSEFYCENYKGLCEEDEEFLVVETLERCVYDCNNEFGEGERFSAPNQSLLQKWLREVYGIHVLLDLDGLAPTKYAYNVYSLSFTSMYDKEFSVPEDAIEAGLLEALKAIKRFNMSPL